MNNSILLSIIFVPTLGAFLLPFFEKISKQLRNIIAFVFSSSAFFLSLLLIQSIFVNDQKVIVEQHMPLGFSVLFCADKLALFMALVSSFISAIIVLYSFGYIDHYRNQNEYYLMVVLFLGSMMGLVFAGNLIVLYVFWEITSIVSWRLIGFFREKYQVLRADKSFLMTVFGALMMLLGFLMLYQQAGSFDLDAIKNAFGTNPAPGLAVFLIMFGIFSKSATLPFHTWLPDAGVAPSPVTALLHAAVLVKIGVYVFARLFIATLTLSAFWHTAIPFLVGLSALVSAGAAMIDNDLKRIIAYSTISQIGFIFLGLSTGNELAIAGGLLYILMHGIAKAGLFLCAGIVEQNAKSKDITQLGGLLHNMPITALSFLFCSFSVMGIPPFGGFFSKYMVLTGAANDHLYISLMFLFGAFMTIIYLFRTFKMVFLGEPRHDHVHHEGSPIMVTCVALLAILSLAGGLLIYYPSALVQSAVQQMLVMAK